MGPPTPLWRGLRVCYSDVKTLYDLSPSAVVRYLKAHRRRPGTAEEYLIPSLYQSVHQSSNSLPRCRQTLAFVLSTTDVVSPLHEL
jgi:hypothetical protein